jgi:RsiW-degrading membrane proteinase PrsW (M82 family)
MSRIAPALVLAAALCIVLLGLVGGSISLLFSLLGPGADLLSLVTFSISLLALTTALGLALAWQSWQSIQGRPTGFLQVKRIWLWILVYVLALAAGQAILSLDLLPPVAFPLFHLLAAVMPPLIIVALVDRGLARLARWREVVLQLSSGAFLSTVLAFTLEFAFMAGLGMAVIFSLVLLPGGLDLVERLADLLQDPTWLQDPTGLVPFFQTPFVLAVVVAIFSGVIPFVEETVKTLGVALLAYQRPSPFRAYLWGVASGAGFALAENLFNTTNGLDIWAPVILLRVGASLLHCFTGGLMGLAWYHLLMRRRWGPALGLYAASLGIHALWNGLAVAMTWVSLPALEAEGADPDIALAGLGVLAILALLVILALVVGVGLLALTLYLRRRRLQARSARETLGAPPSVGPGQPVVVDQAPAPGVSIRSSGIDREVQNE